ncbi:MAG TPA: DUF1622 domain-containing protein [Candidatus Angelobacter sp.]|nr:DUF1622 domain-containing protein [Candidatus Angelobacter sp.]
MNFFKAFASGTAVAVEAAAALLIVVGVLEALIHVLRPEFSRQRSPGVRREAWVRFAVWLLLGLEFELGADVIRTAISPTWTDIGQLGSIAAIRTVLNYFLTKDIEKYSMEKNAEKALAEEDHS